MRLLLAALITLGAIYIWDMNFNRGLLTDGAKSMLRDIQHSIR
jgi:hypothetical protein